MIVDELYLQFIREHPCCRCAAPPRSEPHHFISRKWRNVSRNDYETVPLCRDCHNLVDLLWTADWLKPWGSSERQAVNFAKNVVALLTEYFTRSQKEVGI